MRGHLLIAVCLLAACEPSGAAPDAATGLAKRLDGVEDKLGSLDATLTTVEKNVAALQDSVDALHKKLDEAAAHEHSPARPHTHAPPHEGPSIPTTPPAWLAGLEDIECKDGTCHIKRSVIESLLDAPTDLARQVRIVPSEKDGEPLGFKLYGIRSRSIPRAIGIKNGDLLTHVNGEAWNSLDQVMESATDLRTAKKISLVLDRRGTAITIDIVVDDP